LRTPAEVSEAGRLRSESGAKGPSLVVCWTGLSKPVVLGLVNPPAKISYQKWEEQTPRGRHSNSQALELSDLSYRRLCVSRPPSSY
jgi:hypothetical protein